MNKNFVVWFFFIACTYQLPGQSNNNNATIIPAAERLDQYLPLLKEKRIAIFANHTSVVGQTHLVDTLTQLGVNIKKIFAPEHGFRGTADAGEKVENSADAKTGITVVSLYGKKKRPSKEDLDDVDLLIFDIQDVGVRFYTYISSLQDYLETAIEYDKPLIILDRPNPNGFYVDGPVLNRKFKSFVGMQPVPVVYGMTIGEYARMLIGEKWIDSSLHKKLPLKSPSQITVIPCKSYTHKIRYELPVKPSPNLPEIQSIYWYPSTCYFEGTVLSEGRGTEKPFQIFGHPSLPKRLYSFTPTSREGAKDPKLKDQLCYGWNISGTPDEVFRKVGRKIQLKYLLDAYRLFPDKSNFFLKTNFIDRLAGTDSLRKQIIAGKSEASIRKSWEPELNKFKKTRKKYLLYEDF